MKRVTHVMCMSVFLMFAFAQVASADASCELSVEGGLTDVFGNTVWGGSQLVDVGMQPDAGACSTRASFALNNFAYSICAQRSSGVNLNIPGDVYFGGQWVQEHSGPASCVSGFGLNSYTPLGSGAVLNPGNSIASPERVVHPHLSNRWQHRGESGLNGGLGRQLLAYVQQLGVCWGCDHDCFRQLRRDQFKL